MTRRPEIASDESSPLYEWLRHREEDAHQRPGLALPWSAEQPSYTGTPERLAALRAEQPVDLPVSALPKWARDGDKLHWSRRATVLPDGSVVLRDDAAAWIAENGF